MEKEKFNQAKYMREWQKENMKQVKASYKTEFVDEFKEACKKLGIKQSDVIRKAMQDMIEKANNIDNDDFLKNFNAVTVKPIVDKCQEYIQNMERYGTEFEELETEYMVLCSQLHITSKKFVISESSVAELKVEIAKLENELFEDGEQEYIADIIDKVMEEMGYDLIGNREVTKKSGKRFHDELYTFSEGTAVNIRYDNQGKIAMELGGIDTTDRLPSEAEAARLEGEMIAFCDKFTELEKRLAAKGIVCKNRVSHLPPKAEYAQIINTSDYDIKTDVETFKTNRRSVKHESKKVKSL
jgi:metal-responsive CopG/Arc/MetJ family transcriptional regulator